jgi:hypothetical protein
MRREKSIPFAWYWKGGPLRGNQIRPVYTGPARRSPSKLVSCCLSHSAAEAVHSYSTSASKTHECPDHQHLEPDYCSSETCCESAEDTGTEECRCSWCYDSEHTTTTSTTSTCTLPSESPSSSSSSSSASACSTASSIPSTIHYHSHAHFCYPDYDCPSQPPYVSEPSCTCAACRTYYNPPACTTKHQCPDCPECPSPTRSRAKKTPKTAADACHQCHPSNYYPHYPHYPCTKARARFEEPCEDGSDTATISSGCTDSAYADCEKETCECCSPAWWYRDHPAFRKC